MSCLDPCPIPGCTYRAEHYHTLDAGTADEAIGIECSEAAAGRPCTVDGYYYTRCFAPAVKPELMFALSTVEALIRAAIADEREGLGPLPMERWAEDDDLYWGWGEDDELCWGDSQA